MTSDDFRGLPEAAIARIERARRSGVASSLLSVPGQTGLVAAGMSPIGEVMGCIVEHIGFQGYGGCGFVGVGYGGLGYALGGTVTSGSGGGIVGFAPYVAALNDGWNGAIGRMTSEAAALGADGVVDARIEEEDLGGGNRQFLALGTAVRCATRTRADRPFETTLSGPDVSKLVSAGWMPVSIIVAISVGVRHDDYDTLMRSRPLAPNGEVPGYTDLVHHVRADVRRILHERISQVGADGAIATAPMQLRVHELEVAEGHRDHVGEATLVTTATVRFSERGVPPPPSMQILLTDRKATR